MRTFARIAALAGLCCFAFGAAAEPSSGVPDPGPFHFVWDTRPPDDWLDLWSLPGGRGALLEHMPNGTPLEILEIGPGQWLKVRQLRTGVIGWAAWGNPSGTRVWIYCCWTPANGIPPNPRPYSR